MKLLFVFTFGQSLENMIGKGHWAREELFLRALHAQGVEQVTLVTYKRSDVALLNEKIRKGEMPPWLDIVPFPGWLKGKGGKFLYSLFGSWIQKSRLISVDVVKSNQTNGAWLAYAFSRRLKVPFLYRTGFVLSSNLKKQKAPTWMQWLFSNVERRLYRHCDIATVTSFGGKTYVQEQYGIPEEKVHVITNYVDTEQFAPHPDGPVIKDRILFIGRLAQEKNLEALIDAVSGSGWGIDLIGSGDQEAALQQQADNSRADIRFLGQVGNMELPAIIQQYQFFILPSHFEGMPKALLEAMACGLCCLGTDVSGIREVIRHGETGVLIPGTDAAAIRRTLDSLETFSAPALGRNARAYIEAKHSLQGIVREEFRILQALTGQGLPSQ